MDTSKNNINPLDGFIVNQRLVKQRQGDDLSLRRILGVVGKHKRTLFFTVITVVGLAYLALLLATPKYTSEAKVLVEGQGSQFLKFDEFASTASLDPESLQSQVDIIRSREPVLKTIATLKLHERAEFTKQKEPLPFLPHSELRNLSPFEVKLGAEMVRIPPQVYHYFQKHLKVSRQPKSRVISIQFTSRDPNVSADIVNTLANFYIQGTLERKLRGLDEAHTLLAKEVQTLKRKVRESEQAVQQFKIANGLTGAVGQELLAKQISEINSRLILVRAQREEAEARYRLLQASSDGQLEIARLLDSSIIQRLREQELALKRQRADLGEELGQKHPKMVALNAQLRDISQSIVAEADRIAKRFKDDLAVKAAQEASLEKSLADLKKRIDLSSEKKVELLALEREAASNKRVLEAFLSRVKQTRAKSDPSFYKPDAVMLSKGFPAYRSSLPKSLPVLILAMVAGVFLGLIMVFLKDSIENTPAEDDASGEAVDYHRVNEVPETNNVVAMKGKVSDALGAASPFMPEQEIRQPMGPIGRGGVVNVVGTVPVHEAGFGERVVPVDYVQRYPESSFSQAILMGMSAFFGGNAVSSLLVTGADRSTARTSVAVAAAASLAKTGQKVLLVDADLANPSLHLAFDESNSFGLVDFLEKKRGLGSLIRQDPETLLRFLPAGERRVAPAGKFDLEVLVSMTNALAREYDMVVVIGGSFLVSPDTRALGEGVDRLIYVMPEKVRKNTKVLTEIIKIAKSSQQDAGVVYTR